MKHVPHVMVGAIVGSGLALMQWGCIGEGGPVFTTSRMVYVESNIQTPSANTILSFREDATGALTPVASTPTGGTGADDPSFTPTGVLDSDQNIVVDRSRLRLFAVNQGSDSISVFNIGANGSLTAVAGSPFPSGGHAPASMGLAHGGTVLVVINKNQLAAEAPGFAATQGAQPNIASFTIASNGALSSAPVSTVTLPAGSSPAQALISTDGTLVFDADFLGDTIRSLQVAANGTLTPVSTLAPDASIFTGASATSPHHPLGLGVNPNQPILYANLPLAHALAVYTFTPDGTLTFARSVANPAGAACWIITNTAGTRLYTANALSDDISVFDISGTNATVPVLLQRISLNLASNTLPATAGNPTELTFDPTGNFVFVLTPRKLAFTPANTPVGQGNTLHTLRANPDGTLTEVPNSPVNIFSTLPTPTTVPQGVAAI